MFSCYYQLYYIVSLFYKKTELLLKSGADPQLGATVVMTSLHKIVDTESWI